MRCSFCRWPKPFGGLSYCNRCCAYTLTTVDPPPDEDGDDMPAKPARRRAPGPHGMPKKFSVSVSGKLYETLRREAERFGTSKRAVLEAAVLSGLPPLGESN